MSLNRHVQNESHHRYYPEVKNPSKHNMKHFFKCFINVRCKEIKKVIYLLSKDEG